MLPFWSKGTITEADDEDSGDKMRACDSLIMCIITSINQGLRNGGGIGDVLRKPSKNVCTFSIYFIVI